MIGAIRAGLGWLFGDLRNLGLVAGAMLSAWLGFQLIEERGEHLKTEREKTVLIEERAAIDLALQQARFEAGLARIRSERLYEQITQETDLANAETTSPRAAADADRFIAANRVRSDCPARSDGRAARATAEGHPAQGAHRPGDLSGGDDRPSLRTDEQLLLVKPEFVRTCYANTGRLLDARDWAERLAEASASASERGEEE